MGNNRIKQPNQPTKKMKIITDNLPAILSSLFGAGGIISALFERKKRKALSDQLESDTLKSIQDNYDQYIKHNNEQYELLTQRLNTAVKEMAILHEENQEIKKANYLLNKDLIVIKRENEKIKEDYKTLKNEHKLCE